MKNIKMPIASVTALLLIYTISCQLFPDAILNVVVFMCSPILVIWMVYRILKDGKPSTRTFDEYFYDDIDIKRHPSREASDDPLYYNK